jgi:2'-5' RNA ligase
MHRIEPREKISKLYFLAIIPPSPFYEEVMALKNYFKDQYNSKASLNSPPHITIHMPFEWKEKKEEMLIEKLTFFSKRYSSGELCLKDFNAFSPRVIYIDVIKNDWLGNLQRELHRFCKVELNLFNANHKDHPFHPHLTLAFRDLKKEYFKKAWEEFKERKFEGTFPVTEIVLLKHDGKVWNHHANFKFLASSI